MGLREDLAKKRRERAAEPAPGKFTEEELVSHGIVDSVVIPFTPEPPAKRPERKSRYLPEVELKLPQDIDAEKGILGSIMLGGRPQMFVAEKSVGESHFHLPAHQMIYRALRDMHSDNEPIDLITLSNVLENREELEAVGGAGYVTELFTFVPTPMNLPYYIEIVKNKFVLRSLAMLGDRIKGEAYNPGAEPTAVLEVAMDETARIQLVAVSGKESETEQFTVDELEQFDIKNDKDSVLGYRWLCKGGGGLWVGQSGLGKSSLTMQGSMLWALGLDLWGIAPTHGQSVKSLIIQAENDKGDMAEMLQGVLKGTPTPEGMSREEMMKIVKDRVIFHRDTVNTGPAFVKAASRLIDKHQPDLVWVDPLLSYVGDDISQQRVASNFLRNLLNPIAFDTGIIWMLAHHTGKPPQDPKARSGWTDHDFSYQAFGSSELVNWARAVNILRSMGENVFELRLSKRGKRAGMREYDPNLEPDPDGQRPPFTNVAYLQHAREGIYWDQIPQPAELKEGGTMKSGRTGQFEKKYDSGVILEAMQANNNGRRAAELQKFAYDELNIKRASFYRMWGELKETHKIHEKGGRWYAYESTEKDK